MFLPETLNNPFSIEITYSLHIPMTKKPWINLKIKLRKWIDRALTGTHNHYFCFLPQDTGPFSSFVLKTAFSNIKVDQERTTVVQQCAAEGIVVYVTKHKSYFEYLFYYTCYKKAGLPVPEIGLNYKAFLFQPLSRIFRVLLAHIDYFAGNLSLPDPYKSGYVRQELLSGRSALVSLIERRIFFRRSFGSETDPALHLIEIQKEIEQPIHIIPQMIFYSKKPDKSNPTIIEVLFGTDEKPGRIKRIITLLKNPGRVFVEIAEPVNLKDFIALPENRDLGIIGQSFALRRYLLSKINRYRQTITGPVIKTKEELKENILTNYRLQSFMEDYAQKRNIPVQQLREKADGHLEEIAANFSPALLKIASVLVGFVLNSMFDGVAVDSKELNTVKNMSQKGPLILIPCHKSHVDYLILPYILYSNNMPCPHAVAGENLFFWPLGSIFRALGAFSIRRTFSGAVLYARIFEEYIQKLLEEGFNIELFFEGGRSRTGKLIMPKLGFLSLLLNAYKKGACEDMIFVPVFIGYDQVLEEGTYLHEVGGGQKKPESLRGIFKAGKFLLKRYGKIYLRFHEPISLNELIKQNGSPLSEMSPKQQNLLCRNLGYKVLSAINRVTVVTPHALVAGAILAGSKNKISYEQLLAHVETFMNYLSSQKAMLADTFTDQVRAVESVIYTYVQRKFIEPIPEAEKWPTSNTLYIINENRRPDLEYYKNNCVAFFVPASFTALAILEQDTFRFSAADLNPGYCFLSEFFQNEFAVDVDRTAEDIVQENLQAFIDDAIITTHPAMADQYDLNSEGFKKLKLFAGFVKTFFESYWVVLNFFKQFPQNSTASKDRLKKIQAMGERMYKKMEIERKEALSGVNFSNAEKYFTSHGVKGSENTEKIEHYADAIQKYLNLLP